MNAFMNETLPIFTSWFESPIGWIETGATENGICHLYFHDRKGKTGESHPLLRESQSQISAYFSGTLRFFNLPLAVRGTDFQIRVWDELVKIGFGQVLTYRDLAIRMGGANYTRIVGQANGRNPLSVIIPCHRVIGMNGSLTGYGGGLWRKKWLLEHEQKTCAGFTTVLF